MPSTPSPEGINPAAAVVWMTSARDGQEHAVRDAEFAAGNAQGRYQAECGHEVVPRALVSPCGPRCRPCAAVAASAPGRRYRRTGHPRRPGAAALRWAARSVAWKIRLVTRNRKRVAGHVRRHSSSAAA